MQIVLKLAIVGILPVIASLVFFQLEKKGVFGKLSYMKKQIIIGVIFGGLAIVGTEFGIPMNGAIINARDAAPLCAGLLFGPQAGVIAGLLGGVERWFAVYWGAGTYTRLACSISTCLAGVIGAITGKLVFSERRPSLLFGFAAGAVVEVMHMFMLFITNIDDATGAFGVIQTCATPMILTNACSVMLACFMLDLLDHTNILHNGKLNLSYFFQIFLTITMAVVIIVSGAFVWKLETGISLSDSYDVMRLNVADVGKQIEEATDSDLITLSKSVALEVDTHYKDADQEYLEELAHKYLLAEINVVDKNGIVVVSTEEAYFGYDMKSGDQSNAFEVLNHGSFTFVQPFGPVSYDESIGRKYAGAVLNRNGGYVQVGYNAAIMQNKVASLASTAAHNRHIGETGTMIIADSNYQIVSDTTGLERGTLAKIGFDVDNVPAEGEGFTCVVNGVECYCIYDTVEGYYAIATMPASEVMLQRNMMFCVTIYLIVMIFGVIYLLMYALLKRSAVDNIHAVNKGLRTITDGNLDTVVDVRKISEFDELSTDINSMVERLKGFIADAAARIDAELEFAKTIQTSALPRNFPDTPVFDIHATMDAAKEVGGDFYDFFPIGENKYALLIADVSGKGIPAAMFMMKAKAMIKSYGESEMSAEEVFTRANAELCEGNEGELFITGWFAIVDLNTGKVEFANAGHNPPLIRRKGEGFEYLISRAGLVLAGMEGIKYRKNELQLNPGDTLYLYTDGVTEATDAHNELYGEDRLQNILNTLTDESSEEICRIVRADVDKFVGEAPQFDDITMLVFKYNGSEEGGKSKMKELCVAATVDNIAAVTDFVNEQLETYDCPMKAQTQIDIAIDELFGNIANYAYNPQVGPATVRVEVLDDPTRVVITFIDNGKPFDPLAKDDPDTSLSVDERGIGGLGIYMVKKSMDDITYEYKDGQNILTIKKNFS